jgi:uncharacterized protein involved in exopolysaccharide biosynthesis
MVTGQRPSDLAGNGATAPRESTYDYVRVLVRRWRLLVAAPVIAAVLAAAIALMLPKRWTATAQVVPETSGTSALPNGLGALAGQFGIALPRSDAGESPDFYAALLKSRQLSDSLLLGRLKLPGQADSAPVLDLLHTPGDTPDERLYRGRILLGQMLGTGIDGKTNVIRINVTANSPALAAAITNRYVALLNQFNQTRRATQAHERRVFTEQQARHADEQLRAAEGAVQDFLAANREFRNSPSLNFEYERLQRQVQVSQDVYLTLRRELETSRIQEVNDTPLLTVVDSAVPPLRRSSPARTRLVLIAFLAAAFLAIGWAYALEYLTRLRERDPDGYGALAREARVSRLPFVGRGA